MVPIEQKDWTEEDKGSKLGQNHPLDSTKRLFFEVFFATFLVAAFAVFFAFFAFLAMSSSVKNSLSEHAHAVDRHAQH